MSITVTTSHPRGNDDVRTYDDLASLNWAESGLLDLLSSSWSEVRIVAPDCETVTVITQET